MKSIFIITGTTNGLGKSFLKLLKNENIIISINRKEIIYKENNLHNLFIDLSVISLEKISNFETLLSKLLKKEIERIIFINNAFSMGTLGKIDTLNNSDVISNFNTNVVSSFLLIKSFIHLTKNLSISKKILNISSGAAKHAIDGWSMYCLSKSSLEMLIESILVEYNDYICFNIDPGVMNTQMQLKIRDFKEGKNNQYFIDLFENEELKDTDVIALNILNENIK